MNFGSLAFSYLFNCLRSKWVVMAMRYADGQIDWSLYNFCCCFYPYC